MEPERRSFQTAYAVEGVVLTPKQKQYVAVAFQHLFTHEPAPVNFAATAAPHLGVQPQVVMNTLGKIRDRINKERWGPKLESHELVAHYLIKLTRTVTETDLPPSLR